MRTRSRCLLVIVAVVAVGCGTTPDEVVPGSASGVDGAACGSTAVTSAMLSEAQFAFVGTVSAVKDIIHPWTTDPENSDRPEVPGVTPWVTFDVERWYLRDWGTEFSVWMPDVTVAVGDSVGVGGNAYYTELENFSGQSGEVEFCVPIAEGESSVAAWSEVFGAPIEPSVTAPTTTIVLPATKIFGEPAGVCAATVLTNGTDDETALRAGVDCFLVEHDAGRPVIWDVLIPTTEGDPIVTRYDNDGTTITITTDYSFDNFGSGGVIEQRCADVVATSWLPEGLECTAAPGEGFLADSLS